MASKRMKTALEEYLKCPICLEPTKDAKMLVCGHSFCKNCINKVIVERPLRRYTNGDEDSDLNFSVECPCCRKKQLIKRRSADELGSNFMANDIAEVISDGDRKIPSLYDTCPRHDGNEKKYFCQGCETPICSECAIEEHFDHGARPKPMTEIEITYKEKVAMLLKEITERSMCHSFRGAHLKRIREDGCSAIDEVMEAIEEAFDERHMELSRARNQLYESIHHQRNSFCRQIDEDLRKNEAVLDQVTNAKHDVTDGLKRSRPLDLVKSYKEWKNKVKSALGETGPSLQRAEEELKQVKDLSFRKYPMKCELWVGELVHHRSISGRSERKKRKIDHTAAGTSKPSN